MNIGIDNKAVVDKANNSIDETRKADEQGQDMKRRPPNRHRELQSDGDIQQMFWLMLVARGEAIDWSSPV